MMEDIKFVGGGVCPKCGHDKTEVNISRFSVARGGQWRKRVCLKCEYVWYTMEVIIPEAEEVSEEEKLTLLKQRKENKRIHDKSVYEMRKANRQCVRCGKESTKGILCDGCKARVKLQAMSRAITI